MFTGRQEDACLSAYAEGRLIMEDMNANITLNGNEAKTLQGLRELLQHEINNVVRIEIEIPDQSDIEDMVSTAIDDQIDQFIDIWCDNYLEERVKNIFTDRLTLTVELS